MFGEDVPASFHYAAARKKRLRLLSEVVLRTVKRRLTSSFAIFIFFKIKMAERARFELALGFLLNSISNAAPSTARPSLRKGYET